MKSIIIAVIAAATIALATSAGANGVSSIKLAQNTHSAALAAAE